MTGILLAAGVGSRLRPLTDIRPKCLLPVGGRMLLDRTLSALGTAGIDRCILVTGYLHPMMADAVASLAPPFPVTLACNERYADTGNNYSLWVGCSRLEGDACVVLDADILFAPGLLGLLLSSPHADALALRASAHLGAEEMKVELAGDNVRRIGKHLDPAVCAGESIGIEKFSAATARALHDVLGRRKELPEFYEASFQELIDGGTALATVPTGDFPCMEIDTPEDLRAADHLAVSAGL